MSDLGIPCYTFRAQKPIRGKDMTLAQSLRALLVLALFSSLILLFSHLPGHAQQANDAAQFRAFVASLWPDAQKKNISRATFDRAFQGVTLDESVIAKTRKQPEFTRPVWDYINSAVSRSRIETGAIKARDLDALLDKIEDKTGVDRFVVLAVWGMETNFGSFTGNTPVVRALASLAYVRYRGEFFRNELLTALQILQEGHVDLVNFKGSWAGAMGQTQFMPSSFQRFAVDHDGDGRKNIWSNIPDALASTGNYLEKNGWVRGATWGYEVNLPSGFDMTQVNSTKSFGSFARQGVTRIDGDAMPNEPMATLVAPAGEQGPVFLLTDNFKVIRRYNNSLSYALAVSLLSDRIAGLPALRTPWPMTKEALR